MRKLVGKNIIWSLWTQCMWSDDRDDERSRSVPWRRNFLFKMLNIWTLLCKKEIDLHKNACGYSFKTSWKHHWNLIRFNSMICTRNWFLSHNFQIPFFKFIYFLFVDYFTIIVFDNLVLISKSITTYYCQMKNICIVKCLLNIPHANRSEVGYVISKTHTFIPSNPK